MKRIIIILSVMFVIITSCSFNGAHNDAIIHDFETGKISEEEAMNKCGGYFTIVTLSGKAMHFLQHLGLQIDSAEISILERPWKPAVLTDEEGWWSMKILKRQGITVDCSFILKHPGYPESQTAVIEVGDQDITDITFQVPDNDMFTMLKTSLEQGLSQYLGFPYEIDMSNKCIIVTTAGKSWASMLLDQFPHGEPGAIGIIDPVQPFPMLGPIYFNEEIMPDPALQSTSVDGGILWLNCPEGEYTLSAVKEEVTFRPMRVKARPGILLNASPPYEVKSDQE
jgi:hypothetical protein